MGNTLRAVADANLSLGNVLEKRVGMLPARRRGGAERNFLVNVQNRASACNERVRKGVFEAEKVNSMGCEGNHE
jgi:hypothetical protein